MDSSKKYKPDKTDNSYPERDFLKRVICTFISVVLITMIFAFRLIYQPLKRELGKSLIDNFNQLALIRYHSLENNISRCEEGARSLSSRTMIKKAIVEYQNKEINFDELKQYTQEKYKDGAMALESLVMAERFVGDDSIALYATSMSKPYSCSIDNLISEDGNLSSKLCLDDNHTYLLLYSPILSENKIIGYDILIFDLTSQIHMLCTDSIKSKFFYTDGFQDLYTNATLIKENDTSLVFNKEGIYYHVVKMQNDIYFITRQSEDSLLSSVHQLSKQALLSEVGILILIIIIIYYSIIRYANKQFIDLENSRLYLEEALSESNIDTLTRAGCRRIGEENLSIVFQKFKHNNISPAIILFDIDSLKHVNDTHGHSIGDDVIRSISEVIHANIRRSDMLFRWGGDEFVGIFVGLNKENALPYASKLINSVSKLIIETDLKNIKPTISLGITYFNKEDQSFMDAVNRADRAMYHSKSEGGNKASIL